MGTIILLIIHIFLINPYRPISLIFLFFAHVLLLSFQYWVDNNFMYYLLITFGSYSKYGICILLQRVTFSLIGSRNMTFSCTTVMFISVSFETIVQTFTKSKYFKIYLTWSLDITISYLFIVLLLNVLTFNNCEKYKNCV